MTSDATLTNQQRTRKGQDSPQETLRKPEEYRYGFHDPENYVFRSGKGLNRELVEEISRMKNEPDWMLERRLEGFEIFSRKPMPRWGADLSSIDFDDIYYFIKPSEGQERSWEDVPEDIKHTFERLGVPEAERKFLAGSGAQYESESVYHNLKEEWGDLGVIFTDMDTALREHPEIVKRHFGKLVPAGDNKFAALNTAVWSGGSFVYVPEGVFVDIPVQAYFRINARKMGQFERTLIICEPGSQVHYVEGCTAPTYSSDSLHAAVVEVVALPGSRVRYTTIQNWSHNVYNLVTKRAVAYEGATVEWVDGNLGSKITMKYPSVFLLGKDAHAEILSVAMAGNGQHIDAGAKAIHAAPGTTSSIVSKSISKDQGRAGYRGLVQVEPGARGAKSNVRCDALILSEEARSDTYPYMDIREEECNIEHEASVSKVGEEQLFYLRSRGLSEDEAALMIVNGFIEPIVKELPMEYAVELNRLIELEMEGSVG
ncbi:MAG: Fe-S cluster assembly protein SufB [Planctomycetota bacterium]|jgi:Fe-S cluster assembly protein SufB